MSQDLQKNSTEWSSTQHYVLGVVCLLVGFVVGYFLRGPGTSAVAVPVAQAGIDQSSSAGPTVGAGQISPEHLKQMADQQAAPLVNELKTRPNDPTLLAQVGNMYYDAQQFKDAIDYYKRALQADARNTNTRTDMATAYWYLGDPDRAITEFDTVLKQEPNKPNALFNRGVVRWQGKMDVTGAVADWEQLLKVDPDYPERSKVEQMIAQAKRHSNTKPGEKASSPALH